MSLTTDGLSIIAANMIGSSLLTKTAVGTGSTAFTSGDTSLDNETDRNQITSRDISTEERITFISNFAPPEISGTQLQEYGTFTSGNVLANRELISGIGPVFDGEQECQIQTTFKFFISG